MVWRGFPEGAPLGRAVNWYEYRTVIGRSPA
jgi:hypothetical protein